MGAAKRAAKREARAKKPRADEIPFMRELLLQLPKLPGVRAWRQNVGTVERKAGGFFHSGLPKGAADIGGIVAPGGWILQIETKAEGGRLSLEQEAFARMISEYGGIYLQVNAEDGVEAAVERVRLQIGIRRTRLASELL